MHKISRPNARSLPILSRLIDELVYEQRFAEVLQLIEPYLPLIGRAARRKLFLQRLHDTLGTLRGIVKPWQKIKPDSRRGPLVETLRRGIGRLDILVPEQKRAENAGIDIGRVLFRSADLTKYVAQMRPYFAINLLRLDLYERDYFSDAFFNELISDTSSALYQEIRQNLNASAQNGYDFPEHNRILNFLFSSVGTANDLGVWKPIGEHVMMITRRDKSPEYVNYLNQNAQDFDEERWSDPIFISILFFDLMVSSAARQGIQWHMWLHYFPLFLKQLERTYNTSDPDVDENSEFPTWSARLMYEIIDTLGEWISVIKNLSEDSPHKQIPINFQEDNGNIPASASVALGRCIHTIVMSDRIGDKFIRYAHDVVMRIVRGLRREDVEGQMRLYLIHSIVHNGEQGTSDKYKDSLASLFDQSDHILRIDLPDYIAAIRERY